LFIGKKLFIEVKKKKEKKTSVFRVYYMQTFTKKIIIEVKFLVFSIPDVWFIGFFFIPKC